MLKCSLSSRRRALVAALAIGLAVLALACGSSDADVLDQVKALHAEGKAAEAVPLLQGILDHDPEHPEANYLLGISLLGDQKAAQALWPLRKAAGSDDPIATQSSLVLANVLLATQEYEEVLRVCERLLEREPDQSTAILMRAQAHAGLGDPEKAVADARLVIELEPSAYPARHVLTTALVDLEQYDEAETNLMELHDLARADVPAEASRTCVAIAGFRQEFRSDVDGALQQMDTCLEDYPGDPVVTEWAAWLYDLAGKTEAADALMVQATDLAPHRIELWRQLAGRLLSQGKPDEAIEVMTRAAELLDVPAAWNALAELLRSTGNEEESVAALERGLDSAGTDESLGFQRAELLLAGERYDEALALAEGFSQPAYQHFIRARVYQAREQYPEALAEWQAGIALWPNNSGARYNAGFVAQQLGDLDEALSQYREASRSDKAQTDAALRMAEIYLATGQYATANELAIRHATNRPMDQRLYLVGAEAALRAGYPEDARAIYLDHVAERGGMKQEALLGVALVDRETKGPAAAAATLDGAGLDWSDPANNVPLRALVDDFVASDQASAALARIQAAIQGQGEIAELMDMRGRVYLSMDRLDEAQRDFDASLVADPTWGPAIAGQATLLGRGGEFAKAIVRYDEAAAAEHPDPQAPYKAAQLVLASGDKTAAEARLRDVLRADPSNASAANDLAWILAEEGRDLDRAFELARRAARIDPAPYTWDTLGYVQMARNVPKAAVRAYQAALVDGPDAAIQYRLGVAQAAAGQREEALESLRSAVDLGGFPEEPAARERIALLEAQGGSAE
jgi:tetratricopeptide (TPR) repeat protein